MDEIDKNHRGNIKDCVRTMVSEWLDTGKATWCGLVQALASTLVNKRGLAVEIAKEHRMCEFLYQLNTLYAYVNFGNYQYQLAGVE